MRKAASALLILAFGLTIGASSSVVAAAAEHAAKSGPKTLVKDDNVLVHALGSVR